AERFVGPGIECAYHDPAPGEGLEHGGVAALLFLDGRRGLPAEIEKLGTQQSDTLRIDSGRLGEVTLRADIDQQGHRDTVGGASRTRAVGQSFGAVCCGSL